jgi:hypothetical protein
MSAYTAAGPKSTAMGGVGPDIQGAAIESASGETTRRNSGNGNGNGKEANGTGYGKDDATAVTVDGNGVDVEKAKQEFEQVRRTYTTRSSLHRAMSRRSSKAEPQIDPEKGGDHGEDFDLLDFLVSCLSIRHMFKLFFLVLSRQCLTDHVFFVTTVYRLIATLATTRRAVSNSRL